MDGFSPAKNPAHHRNILQALSTCLGRLKAPTDSVGVWGETQTADLDACLEGYIKGSQAVARGYLRFLKEEQERKPKFEEE